MNQGAIEQIGTPEEIFHWPHTEFVMNFLGQVSRFHSRIEEGEVTFAGLTFKLPTDCDIPDGMARVFIRPHDFNIDIQPNGHPTLKATVRHIHTAGPTVRLELQAESGEVFYAELTQEHYRVLAILQGALALRQGSIVFVTPHNIQIFLEGPPVVSGLWQMSPSVQQDDRPTRSLSRSWAKGSKNETDNRHQAL
jgi:ABC-type sulfate/molybdate transport systems, ATPase component